MARFNLIPVGLSGCLPQEEEALDSEVPDVFRSFHEACSLGLGKLCEALCKIQL